MQYKPIHSVQQLRESCLSQQGDYVHFRMVLAGGLAYSSKRIFYDDDNNLFSVINEIDESYQDNLTEDDLKNETLIIEAIEKNAFFESKI